MVRFAIAVIVLSAAMVSGAAGPGLAAGELALVPGPKAIQGPEGWFDVSTIEVWVAGQGGSTSEYAAGVLQQAVPGVDGQGAAVKAVVRIADGPNALVREAERLDVAPPERGRWRDAFVIECGAGSPDELRLTAGPSGVVYAAYAVRDLLRAGDDHGQQLPRVRISDWPSLAERGWTGTVRDVSERSLATLDRLARWRINAAYYEIYGDRGQDSVPQVVSDIARQCRRRGITLHGLISNWRTDKLLGRPMCASNPDDLARVRRYAAELLDRGCEGLIFLFDDISRQAVDHVTQCPECSRNFGGLAEAQLELMRPMLEVARERGVKRLIVCPTPYWERWQDRYGDRLDGRQYFRTWGNAQLLKGVGVYHCLVRADRIGEVQQAGLRNYVYWYNGVYHFERLSPGGGLPHDLWGGLPEIHFGWYLTNWDDERGIVPDDDAIDALRRLPEQTRRAWLCGGGTDKWALWGSYCWCPERLDPAELSRRVTTSLYGDGTWQPYRQWRNLVRSWLPRLLRPPAAIADEKRQALSDRLLADARAAGNAAGQFAEMTEAAPRAQADREHRRTVASRMKATASRLAELAAHTQPRVEIKPVSTRASGDATRYEQRITLGTTWQRFVLRHAQIEEPDGSLHRARYHFGSGLGMLAPSYRNWYDAGFIDVRLGEHSLDECRPTFRAAGGDDGERLEAVWETDAGTVRLQMSLFADGGLRIDGRLEGADQPALVVKLYTIPNAGWGQWQDMRKYVVTEAGRVEHGKAVTLGPEADWLFCADAGYDVPRDKAEGPCAVLFGSTRPEVITDNARYVVHVDAAWPAGTEQFRLVLWDFHGMRNADALELFRAKLDGYRKALERAID